MSSGAGKKYVILEGLTWLEGVYNLVVTRLDWEGVGLIWRTRVSFFMAGFKFVLLSHLRVHLIDCFGFSESKFYYWVELGVSSVVYLHCKRIT